MPDKVDLTDEPPARITPGTRRTILLHLRAGKSPEEIARHVQGVTPFVASCVIGDLASEELLRTARQPKVRRKKTP